MALFLVELGSEAVQFLCILGLLVAFSGYALSFSFLVVEPLAVLFRPPFDVPVRVNVILNFTEVELGNGAYSF